MRLVLRCDADEQVGLGHLARCLALAEAWTTGSGDVVLVSTRVPPDWEPQLAASGVTWTQTTDVSLAWRPGACLLIDGYDIHEVRGADRFAVVGRLDDIGSSGPFVPVDVVIDPSMSPTDPLPATYRVGNSVVVGPRYAMLRSPFVDLPAGRASGPRDLLISLGGRPDESCRRWAETVVSSVVEDIDVEWMIGVEDVAGLLSGRGLALAVSGSTTWELCRFGIPGVYVSTSPNQDGILRTIAVTGVGLPLGRMDDVDPSVAAEAIDGLIRSRNRFEQLRENGQALVDGRGAQRVAAKLRSRTMQVDTSDPSRIRVIGLDTYSFDVVVQRSGAQLEAVGVSEGALGDWAGAFDAAARAVFGRFPGVQRIQVDGLGTHESAPVLRAADFDEQSPTTSDEARVFIRERTQT